MNKAVIIEAAPLANEILDAAARQLSRLKAEGITPGLALITASKDPYALRMMTLKADRAKAFGLTVFTFCLDEGTDQSALIALIQRLNLAPDIHGIFVQTPLPATITPQDAFAAIDPSKDVDGFHPLNQGRLVMGLSGFIPCAPLGGVMLLKRVLGSLSGRHALVVGRSFTLGKPLAHLLMRENCTITIAHSKTDDLSALIGQADIVVAAIGKPRLIQGEWLKPGCAVLDFGATSINGKPEGDVDFHSAVKVAGFISKSTGAIGPMTVALLMKQTVEAASTVRLSIDNAPDIP